MKTRYFILVLAVLCLTSCGGDKGKVKSAAETFIKAINDQDKVSYCEQYDSLRNLKDVDVVDEMSDDIDVEALDKEGYYEVTSGDVKLVYKVDKDECKIVDSHNLLVFPASYSDLASKTGMPMNKLSDSKIMKLLGDRGEFTSFLFNQNYGLSYLNLSTLNGRYSWTQSFSGVTCVMFYNITNTGDVQVSGSDYEVVTTLQNRSTSAELQKITSYGRDVEPGSTVEVTEDIKAFFSMAKEKNLMWTSVIKPKISKVKILSKYGKFQGDEYSRFSGESADKKEKKSEE